MAVLDEAAYEAARAQGGVTVFDRGLPDVLGYLALCGLPVPRDLAQALLRLRYASPVFLAPFWPEI